METSDLTIEILKGIRDEVRGTNARLDSTNGHLASTNARMNLLHEEIRTLGDDTNARLERFERRQTETDLRLSSELVAVVGAVHEVRNLLREDRFLRQRVDEHERRITAIETRVG